MNSITLSSSSMLARLSIGVYTGRVLDRKVTEEVATNKNATGRVGNYHKKLFSDSPKLDKVIKLAANIRNWHQINTLPWEDDGTRLLPTKHFFNHREQMGKYEEEFNQAVEDFLADYQSQIQIQANKLGDMFDLAEYPDVNSLRSKFRFCMGYSPVPEAGDFRVDINEDAKKELMERYEETYNARVEEAMSDAWGRLTKSFKHIVERLSPDAEGEDKVFRKSMLENLEELVEILPRFNITNDPKLNETCEWAKRLLGTVTAKELRENQKVRANVRNELKEMLSKMEV